MYNGSVMVSVADLGAPHSGVVTRQTEEKIYRDSITSQNHSRLINFEQTESNVQVSAGWTSSR